MKYDTNLIEIYIHIPFCVKKCNYCDFLSFSVTDEVKKAYVDAIVKQIVLESTESDYTSYSQKIVRSIYFGGGTPSTLSAESLIRILEAVKSSYILSDNCEITIEVNPGTVDLKKLGELRKAGFNRLSIGLQSADNNELALLGRIHSYEQFLQCYEDARLAGFGNVSVDVMTALPGQSMDTLLQTIKKVVDLNPEHISTYSLMIEEGTPFFDRFGDIEGPVVGEKLERDMYWKCCEYLKSSGYRHYEISNFAKEGYESRHNCGYWMRIPYTGFGIGAASLMVNDKMGTHGDAGEYRVKNVSSLSEYIDNPMKKEEVTGLCVEDMEQEYMFLGLRMSSGVDYNDFYEHYGIRAEQRFGEAIKRLLKQELITEDGKGIRLSKKGVDYGNYVFSEFIN